MAAKVISLNVRGLRDPIKRRSIFNYYRVRSNLLCLQETHSDNLTEDLWKSEWGGEIYFSHGSTCARGVCILIHPSLPYRVVKSSSDMDGRFMIVELELEVLTTQLRELYFVTFMALTKTSQILLQVCLRSWNNLQEKLS